MAFSCDIEGGSEELREVRPAGGKSPRSQRDRQNSPHPQCQTHRAG